MSMPSNTNDYLSTNKDSFSDFDSQILEGVPSSVGDSTKVNKKFIAKDQTLRAKKVEILPKELEALSVLRNQGLPTIPKDKEKYDAQREKERKEDSEGRNATEYIREDPLKIAYDAQQKFSSVGSAPSSKENFLKNIFKQGAEFASERWRNIRETLGRSTQKIVNHSEVSEEAGQLSTDIKRGSSSIAPSVQPASIGPQVPSRNSSFNYRIPSSSNSRNKARALGQEKDSALQQTEKPKKPSKSPHRLMDKLIAEIDQLLEPIQDKDAQEKNSARQQTERPKIHSKYLLRRIDTFIAEIDQLLEPIQDKDTQEKNSARQQTEKPKKPIKSPLRGMNIDELNASIMQKLKQIPDKVVQKEDFYAGLGAAMKGPEKLSSDVGPHSNQIRGENNVKQERHSSLSNSSALKILIRAKYQNQTVGDNSIKPFHEVQTPHRESNPSLSGEKTEAKRKRSMPRRRS